MKLLFILVTSLFITGSFTALADEPTKTSSKAPFGATDRFSVGPFLGGSVAHMIFSPDPGGHTAKLGGLTGGFLEFRMGGPAFLYTELAFVQHGYNVGTSLFPDTTYHYNYLEFPLHLKLNFGLGETKRVHLFGIVGPTLGLLLKAERKTSTTETNLDSSTESANLMFALGGGVEVWLSEKFALTATQRFTVGFTDIDKGTTQTRTVDLQSVIAAKFSL